MFISPNDNYRELDTWLAGRKKVLVVCDASLGFLDIERKLCEVDIPVVMYSHFHPNPTYDSVVEGVDLMRREQCDCIIGIGGGSSIDVAKTIKLYLRAEGDGENGSFLGQTPDPGDIPFLAMPTTAGTGSEATRYAVVYYNDEKQSITSTSMIPDAVLMDPSVLKTLPLYQKKATMMDALTHAIESYWSVNSNDESKEFSSSAIRSIIEHMDGYLANVDEDNAAMLMAAHVAGQAINITQTTAGHAMCYKITSIFGCSHGHAAALCDRVLYGWMVDNIDRCIDPRGPEYMSKTLDEIGVALGCKDASEGASYLAELFDKTGLSVPSATDDQIAELRDHVNPVRLKNHPIALDKETIEALYRQILTVR